MRNETTSLILNWRTKTGEIPITEMDYDHLTKAISTVRSRLRAYKKQINVLNALKEEKDRREEQAKTIALQEIEGLTSENILLIGSENEVLLDLEDRKEYYQRVAHSGKIVKLNFV
ncbi:hypothetical protein LCGC14_0245920 [marine sediment metagenome]|uniref:Uncharacterized protein n=1 Tax=marine sediment metagenome TaxID=412755 RepID=A0A0F9WR35_9ZZZZ